MEELNLLIQYYIGDYVEGEIEGPIHYDKTLLEIFKLLDDSHMFDKFKYGDVDKYRGDWMENPTIFLRTLKEDKNKLDLFNYLKSTIPSCMLNIRLRLFAASHSIVDDFLNSIKDKNMRKEILDIGENIVKDRANLNLIEILAQYRKIIPEEDIVYIIEQMPETERVTLINNCVLSKESIDEIIEYTMKEKGNCTALEKMKLLGDLKFTIAEGRKNANEGISDLDKDTMKSGIYYDDGVNR